MAWGTTLLDGTVLHSNARTSLMYRSFTVSPVEEQSVMVTASVVSTEDPNGYLNLYYRTEVDSSWNNFPKNTPSPIPSSLLNEGSENIVDIAIEFYDNGFIPILDEVDVTFSFSETAVLKDSSGNENDGIVRSLTRSTGAVGKGIKFDGVKDGILLHGPLPTLTFQEPLTIYFSVQNALDGPILVIGDKTDNHNTREFWIVSNTLRFRLWSDVSGSYVLDQPISTFDFSTPGWHQVGIVLNRTADIPTTIEVETKINDSSFETYSLDATFNISAVSSGTKAFLGQDATSLQEHWEGYLDDFIIYNRALDEVELLDLVFRSSIETGLGKFSSVFVEDTLTTQSLNLLGPLTLSPNQSGNAYIGLINEPQLLQLTNSGVLVNGTLTANEIVETSSILLKKDIVPLYGSLNNILKLAGVTYTRISSGRKEVGLIAEEVEKVIPDLVTYKGGYKAISYSRLTAYLIESIKSLKNELDVLKKK